MEAAERTVHAAPPSGKIITTASSSTRRRRAVRTAGVAPVEIDGKRAQQADARPRSGTWNSRRQAM